ncbi:hypothetical protein ACH41H_36400 [Streptomyces sp. NPDC020800]|uniref:hypothetical protein n=1 Tax=Streptomyces sp. NPDC020800 TaxID=3365092 RepID=UPI00379A8C7A
MRCTISLPAAILAAAALTACSSNASHPAGDNSTSSTRLAQSATHSRAVSVRLAWSRTVDDSGDKEIWYVARIKNPGTSPASVALDVRALDKSGTIVGSSQDTLPNVPAGATFDYFGDLGGGLGTDLTGTPAKLQVSQAKNAFGQAGSVDNPILATSQLTLTKGSRDYLPASIPSAYDMTVKVTNNTDETVTGGVTQQVVLYDAKGNVAGGGTGMSDNAPDSLPAGMSYREKWTGIPATAKATRAVYTVWSGV